MIDTTVPICTRMYIIHIYIYQDILPVRLSGGNSSAGRVEVFESGAWGTVCDVGWDDRDAAVVCRHLGRAGGAARPGGTYGAGTGNVWLNNSTCGGTEGSLRDCQGNVFQEQVGECGSHSRDAGVECGSGELPHV